MKWNANGLQMKTPEFHCWILAHKVDVVAVQEAQLPMGMMISIPSCQTASDARLARWRRVDRVALAQSGARLARWRRVALAQSGVKGGDIVIYIREGL